MQKRSDRNKSLYDKVDREIEKVASKNSNKEFKDTDETLKTIDPGFFGGEVKNNDKKEKLGGCTNENTSFSYNGCRNGKSFWRT